MTTTDAQLALDGLSTRAGTFRLSPVDLRVNAGQALVVLGPSGAGKTTLLDTIAGFRASTAGSLRLAGNEITRLPPERRRIGMVFQHAALFPHLTVRENVQFGPRARGYGRKPPVDALLARFGLVDHADRSPRSLSGGERQRVALARALAADPALLLLDEPLSALDQPTREDLRGVLHDLLTSLGIPAIHVTHDRDEALSLGDHIAVLVNGQLRQTQASTDVASHPRDPDVARLLGWTELGQASIARATITLGDLQLPTTEQSGTAAVYYRPENIILSPAQPTSTPSARLTRTIQHILPTVPLARVRLAGDPALTALVLHRDVTQLGLRTGQTIELQLPTDALKTFIDTPSSTPDRSDTH